MPCAIFKVMTLTQEYALDHFYLSNYHLLPKGTEEVVQEGVIDVAKDMVQFLASGVVEYGMAATIAGAPAAPILETMVDAAFTAESVTSTVASIGDMKDQFDEANELMGKVLSLSLANGFEAFYEEVLSIWKNAEQYMGDKVDELIEKTKKTIYKFVTKLADAVTDAIKLLIPDAIMGTAIAEGLEALLKAIAENAYSVLTGIMSKLGKFTEIVTSPEKTREFFEEAFTWAEQAIETMLNPPEKGAVGKVVGAAKTGMKLATGLITLDIAKKQGLKALKKLIENNKETVISAAVNVSGVLLPTMFGLLASYQILMSDDWKTEEEKEGEEEEAKEEVAAEVYQPEYLLKHTTNGKFLASVSLSGTHISSPLLEFKNKKSAIRWIKSALLEMKQI